MQQILLLDNFDSFTFNLEHYLGSLGAHVDVIRNNVDIPAIERYDKVVLSPGPGLPPDAGCMMDILREISGKIPVLGVCLGMQAIALHIGGEMYNQHEVKHGVQETIDVKDSILFRGMESQIDVGLYHSWAVREHAMYNVTANSTSGIIMAIENSEQQLYGVQFHPESIMTPKGLDILANFLSLP